MTTPTIENCSLADIQVGHHVHHGSNTVLIRILDPHGEFHDTFHKFSDEHHFCFLDAEFYEYTELFDDTFRVNDKHASEIAEILKDALYLRKHVVVHCFAGSNRSGAVVEAGIHLGFLPIEHRTRGMNSTVRDLIIEKF